MLFCKTEIMAQNVAFACVDVNIFQQMLNLTVLTCKCNKNVVFWRLFGLFFGIMFTKIVTVLYFCDREVQFWSFVAACIWIFLYEKVQSRLIFLFFRLGYIKFSLFASSAGEICVLHRYGKYLLRCSALWRAAGRRAKSPKCRKVSFLLISSKLYSTGSICSDGVEKT